MACIVFNIRTNSYLMLYPRPLRGEESYLKHSIIIPSYNNSDYLYDTLFFLGYQYRSNSDMEIIVVDDGSTDSTIDVVESFITQIEGLGRVFIPRSQLSSRARARNVGIEHASGDILTFLDAGLLVPPSFSKTICEIYLKYDNTVVVPYIFGLGLEPDQTDMSLLEGISPLNLMDICRKLSRFPVWLDDRDGLFDLVENDLATLPAPWASAWGAGLTLPKQLAIDAGGFDETFLTWGSEDTDFSYRVYQTGASFYSTKDAYALHIPHQTIGDYAKAESNFHNRLRIHQKHNRLDTELYPYVPDQHLNQIIDRFNNLVIHDIIPRYHPDILTRLSTYFLRKGDKSLLIGTDSIRVASLIRPSHVFTINTSTYRRFRSELSDINVEYLLGCYTLYSDCYFDVTIVTDFFRILPPILLELFLQEITRISRKVLFLFTEEYHEHVLNSFRGFAELNIPRLGNPWINLEEFRSIVEKMSKNCILVDRFDFVDVITVE